MAWINLNLYEMYRFYVVRNLKILFFNFIVSLCVWRGDDTPIPGFTFTAVDMLFSIIMWNYSFLENFPVIEKKDGESNAVKNESIDLDSVKSYSIFPKTPS